VPDTRRILQELSAASPRVSFEELNLVLDKEKAEAYGVTEAPAIVVLRQPADGEPWDPASASSARPWATSSRRSWTRSPSSRQATRVVGGVAVARGGGHLAPAHPGLRDTHLTALPRAVGLAHRMAIESRT